MIILFNNISLLVSLALLSGFQAVDLDCLEKDLYAHKKSADVFIGKVTKIELIGTMDTKTTFVIDKVYKDSLGELSMQSEIFIFSTLDVFGYQWDIGGTYLVFVKEIEDNKRLVDMCSLTTKILCEYDYEGNWIGYPTLQEIKDCINNRCIIMEKWRVD